MEPERRVKLVGAFLDPPAQRLAARLSESFLLQLSVAENGDVPAEIAEHGFDFRPEALVDDSVEALAIVIDDPPRITQAVLPSLKHRLGDIAFVEFRIAEKRNHPAFRCFRAPVFRADVILHQR